MSGPSPGAAPRGRLLRKYVVVFVGLVGGVLMASSLVELYFAYQETKRAIVRVERARATAVAAKIEEFVRDAERRVRETTRAASDDPAAAQLGQGKLAFRGGLGAALSEQRELDFLRLLRDVPAISELSHLDVSGKEQLHVSRLALDAVGSQEDFSQAPKFLEARSGKTYWSPVYLRNGVEPYLTLAVPVGQYAVEVTTAEISLKAVQQAIAQIQVGEGGYGYVVDSRGRLFAHPDIGLVRQNRDLSALPQVRDAYPRRPAAPGSPGGPDTSGGPIAPTANDAATVAEGLQGGQILAAHAAIAPLGWLVLVERPLADAYAPLRAPITRSAAIFALGLGLSILASILLARRMVAPIRALQEGASRIGAGDLGHRVDVHTGDELEALGHELNRTAGQLEESYANLEQKVEARTRELADANAGLTEALEQQTATAEILRAISGSPTDIQPVLDTVARAAARFCGATDVAILRLDAQVLRGAAGVGPVADVIARQMGTLAALEVPVTRGSVTGRAVLERRTVHVRDLAAEPEEEFPEGRDLQRRFGHHTMVATPLLREGTPLGVIALFRLVVDPFSDKQLELLRIFADQAVIAIENVRLFTELAARNRDLTETLEQQTATSEILRVISSSPTDVQPVFDTIVGSAARLCEAAFSAVARLDDGLLHLVALNNMAPEEATAYHSLFPRPPGRNFVMGRALLEGQPVHVEDVLADPGYDPRTLEVLQSAARYRTFLGIPMLREGVAVGVIGCGRRDMKPFTPTQIELVKTFADQAVIAIENVRLFQELETRNRDLTEALEHQTATAEILRVISGSPTDVQPVFDTIARNAARLCEAQFCFVYRFDGQLLHFVAHHGVTTEGAETVRRAFPAPPNRGSAAARAVLECAVAQIPDVLADADFVLGATATAAGYRSALAVPMLRDGLPIGSIAVARAQVGLLPNRQIALLKTFADQAVIAIENVRLFQELEARTRDLTRSVGELRALGEVSQAVSSTLDLETVLATIVTRAVELSGSYSGIIYEYEEPTQTFHARATHQITPEYLEILRASPIHLGEGAMGRAGAIREPVEISDVEDERQAVAPQVRGLLAQQGTRSLLAVPLVRENRLLGGLVVLRREQGGFSDEVVATLRTFAAQSVLAIHNAGLFREIQREKQYSEALVATSPVAIATMDLHGTVVGWNPGAERLFGYSSAEALGRPMEDLVATPEVRDEIRANIRHTLEGEWIRAIGRRARKDRTLVDVEISSMPVVLDGAKVGMIGIYHDITELLRARREAEAANEAKSAFLATMSHEIRTPMNAVIGMSGLLLGTALTDEQHEYAEIIRQSGDALLTVINDILDFSKIEAGKLELESQPFDLRECVESALDLVAARAAEKGLDLAYVVGDGAPPAIVGDVTRLRQVLLNLLSNAVKFTERGEVVLSATARGLDGATPLHELTFTVRDTGIGIPPDRLGRLFQSFSQVDASTTRRYGGTGLGLAISQRLTELMGGRIAVTSEVGTGSEFRVTIRAAAAEAPASTRRDLTGVQPSLRGKRVLVVDDNATNRRILTTHLDAWGMQARATGSPLEALAWIRADERFDVGILDMHMPEMDGATLARAILEHPAETALPLILFTSLGRREARAESEGFAAYLHKPIKPSQLFDALVSVLAAQPTHVRERVVARSELDPDMARRRPLRILLAEDNVVNQKVALRLLGQMGYRADVAGNGLEAIEAVARQTYDVVLMDVQMPELDGFEASREINRRWPGAQRPRLVAMTANALQGDRELCVAAGMDDYVAKPIRIEELVAALERCPWRRDAGARGAPGVGRAEALTAPGPSASRRGPPGAPLRAPSSEDGPEEAVAAVVDRATIERLTASMGGPFVAELIDTFVEDARELIATLRRSMSQTDVDAFRRAAHSLKSTSETVGASGLAGLARELETMARSGALDGADRRLEPLADAYEIVTRTLGDLRRDLSG